MSNPLELLPHGPEFRFVDRVVKMDPGKSGSGEYLVRGDEPFLRGHFPGQPLFPGVLLLEAVAQLAGIVAQCDPTMPPLPRLRLTGLRAVKILDTAKPGELIQLEARISGRLASLVHAEATASLAGRLLLKAELVLGAASDTSPAAEKRNLH